MLKSLVVVNLSACLVLAAGCVASSATSEDVAELTSGVAIEGLASKCLDVLGGATQDGSRADLWTCNWTNAQKWTISQGEIIGPGGKCLDVRGNVAAPGTPVQLWTCWGGAGQRWTLNPAGTITGIGGLCLDVRAGGTADNTTVQVSGCNGTASQRWHVAGRPQPCVGTQCEQASSADGFVDTIGVVTHMGWRNGQRGAAFPIMRGLLLQSGIRHVREGLCWYNDPPKYPNELCGELSSFAGTPIHINAIIGYQTSQANVEFHLQHVASGVTESFEGVNEPNNKYMSYFDKDHWEQWTKTAQQTLWNTVQAWNTAHGTHLKVYGPSIVFLTGSPNGTLLGDLSAYLDYGNMHDYFGSGNPGETTAGINHIEYNKGLVAPLSGTKRIAATENGYGNNLAASPWLNVPTDVMTRYVPRMFLEQANHGVVRTYEYTFLDENDGITDGFEDFGLVSLGAAPYTQQTPKPAYYAVRDLISALSDRGPAFTPTGLDYTLAGSTQNVHHTLLQKRDGSFDLLLWIELPSWNQTTQSHIAVPPQWVQLHLGSSIASAEIRSFDPASGNLSSSAAVAIQGNSLTIRVTDSVSILHLTPLN